MAANQTTSHPFLEGRGKDFCRGCGERNLFSGINLGDLPIANELLASKHSVIEKFPLHLRICSSCGLGQVADVVTPERIFRDYRYLSSVSSTFLMHASNYVDTIWRSGIVTTNDWVLEIASNDGYLLKNFLKYDIKAIGIEPAKNVSEISRALGIETISEFFSARLAAQILHDYGFPKLIIANNVMAHVPDLIDFIQGLSILCGPETQISVENPSLANILIRMQFDTIYHEHYSYLSATSVSKIGELHGLHLSRVEKLEIHGGSNRYWLTKKNENLLHEESTRQMISSENEWGLFNSNSWTAYADEVRETLANFHYWLQTTKASGGNTYGYGAAAKASTILNSIDIDPGLIVAIADASIEKQNRFMPPYGIEVISPQELFMGDPTDVVIFPWNIKAEIANYLRSNLGNEVRIWCAIPEMHQVVAE